MSTTQVSSSKFVRVLAKQLHAELAIDGQPLRGAQEKSVLRLDATDVTRRTLRQAIRKACRISGVRAARGFFGVRHPSTDDLVFGVRGPGKAGWQATLVPKGSGAHAKLNVIVSL